MDTLIATLQQLQQRNTGFSTSALNASDITALMAEIRASERALTSIKVKIGQRSDELAADQAGPDASETFSGQGDVSNRAARSETNRSRTANNIPEAGNALDHGAIGGEHLDALDRARKTIEPELQELFDQCAGDLINRTDNTPVDAFNKQVRRLADRITNDHGLATAQKQRESTALSMWKSQDGMGHIRGDFDAELYEVIRNGIARQAAAMAAASAKSDDPVTKGKHLDALALAELVRGGNASRGRADITVVVDGETFTDGPHDHSMRETSDGEQLAYETVRRLCCDALIRKVVLDSDGKPLDVGRAHRTATDRQCVALKAIYSTCGWSNCGRPVSWCQAHHITEWEHGGLTDLDNLIPLCSRHHHSVHEGQWVIKLLPDRTLRIFRPDGRHHATARPTRLANRDACDQPPGRREPVFACGETRVAR